MYYLIKLYNHQIFDSNFMSEDQETGRREKSIKNTYFALLRIERI